MLIFNNLIIEGFGSILHKTEFKLDQPGLNLLKGKVGSGKTTIPSSLCWVLYGVTLKGKKSSVSTWEERRDDKYKGTKIVTNFIKDDINYEIIRCKDYKGKIEVQQGKKIKGGSKTFIFVDGEYYTKARNKSDQQEYINNLVGYSFDLFKNSIVFGQKMKRIIEETGGDKKKIFEEAFRMTFIEEAKEDEKAELKKLTSALLEVDTQYDLYKEKYKSRKQLYKKQIEIEKSFEKNKKSRIKELKQNKAELKLELSELTVKPVNKDTSKIDNKITSITQDITQAKDNNNKIENIKDQVKELEKTWESLKKKLKKEVVKCPTCGKPMGVKDLKKYKGDIKKEITRTLDEKSHKTHQLHQLKHIDIEALSLKKLKLNKKRDNLIELISSYKNDKKRKKKIKEGLKNFDKKIKKVKDEKLNKESPKIKKEIKEFKESYKALAKDREKLKKDMDIKNWLITDPLSNNGLKSYIFNSLLSKVNDRLFEYSKTLGFLVEFGIDMDSHHKDFYQCIMLDNIIIPYEDLSGGQKQLVDTSVAFAIHDVISELRPTNILFLDEPFESLGEDEVEIIEQLVNDKAKGKSLFLITHHPLFNPLNANLIKFKLHKNKYTKIY